jgi:hypothetical protein
VPPPSIPEKRFGLQPKQPTPQVRKGAPKRAGANALDRALLMATRTLPIANRKTGRQRRSNILLAESTFGMTESVGCRSEFQR